MRTIVVDSDNYKASGIEAFFFPGGEPHARIPKFNTQDDILLFLKLRTWDDVGLAAAVLNAFWFSPYEPKVFVPYMPGGRQDRSDGFTPLTIGLITDLLDVRTHEVWSFDPHSTVTNNNGIWASRCLMPEDLSIQIKDDVVGIIAPDEGATARALSFRNRFYPRAELIKCEKSRDFVTGKFTGFEMPALIRQGRYIIVDDICDGGGTFNLLANAFFNDDIGVDCKLELFVSHGIFSKGIDAINPYIEHITTTNSWCQIAADLRRDARLTVLRLEQLFPKILGAIDA